MSTALPSGFSLRSQGGSTFLEIDLSHYDFEGIREFAQAIAKLHGYSSKPQRRPWRGSKDRRGQTTRKAHKATQRASTAV